MQRAPALLPHPPLALHSQAPFTLQSSRSTGSLEKGEPTQATRQHGLPCAASSEQDTPSKLQLA
jgi:hypothetical protein